MHRLKELLAAGLALLFLLPMTGTAYDALVAFGDSDTDTGNLPSSPPEYWNQRFSNGPVWIEYLAQRLGITYDPASNFAVSGNESTDLGTQINRFGGPGDAQDPLFAIWAGSNDILNHLSYGTSDSAWARKIDDIVSSLTVSCDLLYNKGARKILLFNIADLTRLPSVSSTHSGSFRSYLLGKIRTCNTRIANAVPGVVASHPGLEVYLMDHFSDVTYLLDHYSELGFVNATVGALNSTLADKSFDGPGASYVFWDANHYTTKAHALFAEWIAGRLPASSPPPPTVVLTSPALGAHYSAPAQITLAATVDPKGNTIARVEFVQNGSVLATVTSAPYAYDWDLVPAGTYLVMARVVDNLGRSAQTPSIQVDVTTPAGSALPAPWQHGDIGAPANSGAAYVTTDGVFSISGAGADIWGAEDAFQFAFQPVSGDCTILARVTAMDNTDGFAKACVMFRQDLSAGSANVAEFITPTSGTGFQARMKTSGATTYTAGVPARPPCWLKLERTGDQVRGYSSIDGQSWALTASAVLAMTNPIYAGLAVTSHNDSLLNTSSFDQVQVELATPPVQPPTPARLTASWVPDGRMRLTISGTPGATYVCEASPDLQTWSGISTNLNASGVTVVFDSIPEAAGQRYYRAVVRP